MKFLKIALGIIALLVIGFFLLGVFIPEIKYTVEVEANKPLKESWAVFTDESKNPEWITGLKSVELISGTKNEPGAKSKVTVENDGQLTVMEEELLTVKEMEQYEMKFEHDAFSNHVDIRFAAVDENTTSIKVSSEMTGKGAVMKSMFALMKGSFKPVHEEMYAKLKKLIEENTTDYFPEPVMEAGAVSAEAAATAEDAAVQ